MGSAKDSVKVNAEQLANLLPSEDLPVLIYLNSCDSQQVADELVNLGVTLYAIGSTAPITTTAGRNGAFSLYQRILAGHTLNEAFASCATIVNLSSKPDVSVKLFPEDSMRSSGPILYRVPRIIADFRGLKPKEPSSRDPWKFSRDEDGDLAIDHGIVGCPASATQVVFFTDDDDYVYDEYTMLRRSPNSDGVYWTGDDVGEDESWYLKHDVAIFATVVLFEGSSFTISSTICKAIQSRFEVELIEPPGLALDAIAWLSRKSIRLSHSNAPQKASKRSTTATAKAAKGGTKKSKVGSKAGPKKSNGRGKGKR